ncbi:unnamed protein product, partial [Heterosigma akashiwo]
MGDLGLGGRQHLNASIQKIWAHLEEEEAKLKDEQKRIQSIWMKITECHKNNEEKLKEILSDERLQFIPAETVVKLNVGGQAFEAAAGALCQDPFSVLAALCRRRGPLGEEGEGDGGGAEGPWPVPGADGAFFLDRDWFLFRYILQFLRSGTLPEDAALLRELYVEASFYRLNTLRKAIKERFTLTARGGGSGVRVPLRAARPSSPPSSWDRR